MTNQEMLDRYIYAVKILLPLNKWDDIAEEIRSNLLALIEDQEALLGHELHGYLRRRRTPTMIAV
jgi:hypothetical protein